MREYFVHRSLYHLKEGDPHAWAIPRLTGQAKASFVAVEYDEFGAGRGARCTRSSSRTAGRRRSGLELPRLYRSGPRRVVGSGEPDVAVRVAPQVRGAAVGHFASTEITSPPGSARMVDALERMSAPAECVEFYREHVEADAVHEQVVRTDVVGDLVAREPHLDGDVVFGIRARDFVEDRVTAN